MVFKISKTLLFASVVLHLFSCVGPKLSEGDENIIGNKLENVSSLKTTSGGDSAAVVLFEPLVQKIYQFNLDQMSLVRALNVLNLNQPHYVLHDTVGNYIVDLSVKHISIFDKNSNPQHNPIRFFGKPLSAAFRPELGLLVMYDDLQTAGIVQMNSNGVVQKSAVFGSIVSNDQTIAAGDLLEDGNLVLALSDNSLAEINIAQSLTQNNWSSLVQSTGLSEINWVAPVPSKPRLIFIKSKNQVSLYDLDSHSVISSVAVTGEIEKYSKSFNPHILERVDNHTLKLIYTNGTAIQTRVLNRKNKTILTSDLDLTQNMWSFVEVPAFGVDSYSNNLNIYKYNREIVRYRISDMAALQSKAIPDRAQVKLANDYLFCLFSSDLGYASKNSILDDTVNVIRNFNVKNF